MLIICSDKSDKAVDWLVGNTNKNFCFKQLLELGQLVSSAIPYCDELLPDYKYARLFKEIMWAKFIDVFGGKLNNLLYKRVYTGKDIQKWILKNPFFVYIFFCCLYKYCSENINISQKSVDRLMTIATLLKCYLDGFVADNFCTQCLFSYNYQPYDLEAPMRVKTAIWRYSKDYESEYPTNSELDIDLVCELYRKYIIEFKFKKSEV